MELGNPIDSEKENAIKALVEKEIAGLKTLDHHTISEKISSLIPTICPGEAWLCHIEH